DRRALNAQAYLRVDKRAHGCECSSVVGRSFWFNTEGQGEARAEGAEDSVVVRAGEVSRRRRTQRWDTQLNSATKIRGRRDPRRRITPHGPIASFFVVNSCEQKRPA